MSQGMATVCLVALLTACVGVGRVPFEPDDAALETNVLLETDSPPDTYAPTPDTVGGPDICTRDCAGKECGNDGCGGSCGICLPGVQCRADGTCEDDCVPDCWGKECGTDGCGATCGACPPGISCLVGGLCEECVPDCWAKECGPDACGGDCGFCANGAQCNPITAICEPYSDPCKDKECGAWDGEWCGDCPCPECDASLGTCDLETGQCIGAGEPDDECPAIFECMSDCPEGDQGCQQNCINSAVIEAQMAFNNLLQCWVDVDYWGCWDLCPNGVDYADCPEVYDCVAEKDALCEDQYYACYIPGDLTCDEIFACFDTCPNNENPCMQNCDQSGTIEAQKTAAAMWDCYDEAGVYDCWDLCPADASSMYDCPPEGQECIEKSMAQCQDATNACFATG